MEHRKFYKQVEIVNTMNGVLINSIVLRDVQAWQNSAESWDIFTTDNQEIITTIDMGIVSNELINEDGDCLYLYLDLAVLHQEYSWAL